MDDFTPEDEEHFLRGIREFLRIDRDIHIKRKRRGSIKITLSLLPEEAEELLWAVRRGELEAIGAVDAVLTDSDGVRMFSPESGRMVPNVSTAPYGGFTNSIGMEFILIPAGEFTMGSLDSEPDMSAGLSGGEKPAHLVTISQPFYLGTYPVTQGQWQDVMGSNPSHFQGDLSRPVERVSWDD